MAFGWGGTVGFKESNFDLVIFKRKRKRIPLSSSKNNKFVLRAWCLMFGEAFCLVDEKFEILDNKKI